MRMDRMTDEELDAVAGGSRDGGVAGTKGITQMSDAEIDAVAGGGDRDGGVAGVKG